MNKVASSRKIDFHRERVQEYLKEEKIFPVCMELDITTECTRVCPDCPSCRSPFQKSLSMDFIRNLFASFERQTKGLLMSGGEATMSPLFPETVAEARRRGFEEIAVVTNGSLLDEESVIDALLEHVSTIRISMYDWGPESSCGIEPVLSKIQRLRRRIDKEKSNLRIGVSALTSKERAPRLAEIAGKVADSGAHWAYFHPICQGWETANLVQVDQTGVLESIEEYRRQKPAGFEVFVSPSRYVDTPLSFRGYHAAHFLLTVGADGINYLGAEVKYQPRFAVADVAGEWSADFLWRPERMTKISGVDSRIYPALKSRHRGVLYNDYIDKMRQNPELSVIPDTGTGDSFWFPHIL